MLKYIRNWLSRFLRKDPEREAPVDPEPIPSSEQADNLEQLLKMLAAANDGESGEVECLGGCGTFTKISAAIPKESHVWICTECYGRFCPWKVDKDRPLN